MYKFGNVCRILNDSVRSWACFVGHPFHSSSYGVLETDRLPSIFLSLNPDSFLFPRFLPLADEARRVALLAALLFGIAFFGSTLVLNIGIAVGFKEATANVGLAVIFGGATSFGGIAAAATWMDKWLAVTNGYRGNHFYCIWNDHLYISSRVT